MGADPPGQAPQATGSLDVRRWVEQVCGGTVVSWQRAPTGGSRETYLVEVARAGSSTALVLRAESWGSFAGTPINVAKEATVYRALEATAVPVPRVLGVAPGGSALLMSRVPGTADLGHLDDDGRRDVMAGFIDVVADLHNLDVDELELPGFARPATATEHATTDLELWARLADEHAVELDPLVRYAGAYLRHHPPSAVARTVLVQGDTGPGNFLVEDGRVTALIDMEFAHLGDPMDDLAWILSRLPAAGVDPAPLLQRYTARSGIAVDRRNLAYYEVAVQYRCAVTTSLAVSRGGGARGWAPYLLVTERYVLGTASALCALLGVEEPAVDLPDPPPTPRTAYFDHLLEGVRAAVRALPDPWLKESTRNLQILVHYLRAHDRAGRHVADQDAADLRQTLGLLPDDLVGLASAAEEGGRHGDLIVLGYLLRRARRQAVLWQSLLDRPRR